MVLKATTDDAGEDLAKSLLSCCKCLFPNAQFCVKERTARSRRAQKVSMDKTFVWSHPKETSMNSHHTTGEVKKSKTKALGFHTSIKIEIIFFKKPSPISEKEKEKIFFKTQPAQKQQSLLIPNKEVVAQCGHLLKSLLQKHSFGLTVGPSTLQVTPRRSHQSFVLIEIWQTEG